MLKSQNKWRPVLFSLMLTATAISVEVTEPQVLEASLLNSKAPEAWDKEKYKNTNKYTAKKYEQYLKKKIASAKGRNVFGKGGRSFKNVKSQQELDALHAEVMAVLNEEKKNLEGEELKLNGTQRKARLATLNKVIGSVDSRYMEVSQKFQSTHEDSYYKQSKYESKARAEKEKRRASRGMQAEDSDPDKPLSYEQATGLPTDKKAKKLPATEDKSVQRAGCRGLTSRCILLNILREESLILVASLVQ